MRAVRGLLLSLAALCLFGDTPLGAQNPFEPRRRRDPNTRQALPGRLDRKAADELLNDALKRAGSERDQALHDIEATADLLAEVIKNPKRYGLSPEKLLEMAKEIGKNPADAGIDLNDPKMQELARRLAGKININPEQRDAIKRVVGDLPLPDIKPPDGANPPDVKPPIGPNPPDVKPIVPMPPGDMGQPRPIPVAPPVPTTPAMPQRSTRSWIGEKLANLRPGSRAISDGVRDRIRGLFGRDTRLGGLSRDVGRETGRLLPKIDGAGLMRSLGRVVPDRIISSPPRVNISFNSPSMSGPSLPSAESMGNILMIVVVLAVGFALMLMMPKTRRWITGGDGWKLGPWPIAPSAVRTRDDLIKAFEYLALLCLGRQASSANHLDIAQQLGEVSTATPQRRSAAYELADLYEQARYAPPQEDLSSDEMDTARRDLCMLAGVAGA